MNYQGYKRIVNRFLSNDSQQVLLIRGEWGAGKTFLWEDVAAENLGDLSSGFDKYCYISLFGVGSLEDLKQKLSHSRILNANRCHRQVKALDLFSPQGFFPSIIVAWRFLSVGFFKLFRFLDTLPFVHYFSRFFHVLGFSQLQGYIVCIDDLERKSSSLSSETVLGLVDYLSQMQDCKIVLIAGRQLEIEDYYRKGLEKVVDAEVNFTIGCAEYLENIVSKELASDEFNTLREAITSLGITNIRTIRKIVDSYNFYIRSSDFKDHFIELISALTLWAWIRFEPDSLDEEFISDSLYSVFLPDSELSDEVKEQSEKIFSLPAFQHGSVHSCFAKDLIYSGYLDSEKMQDYVANLASGGENRESAYYKAALDKIRMGAGDDTNEVIALLKSALSKPQELTLRTLSNIVEFLLALGVNPAISPHVDKVIDHSLEVIEAMAFPSSATVDIDIVLNDLNAEVRRRLQTRVDMFLSQKEPIDIFSHLLTTQGSVSLYAAKALSNISSHELVPWLAKTAGTSLSSLHTRTLRLARELQHVLQGENGARLVARVELSWLKLCDIKINQVRIGEAKCEELNVRRRNIVELADEECD
ncbi:hypothetical protein [Salinicola halophyticus]|uniref:hypothetical protein n=1 Tax=Salinicola halophyticus TaxID=1808881 RepID=UPI003F48BA88